MDLIKCPRCGEEYSPSYRKCPFCEEGDHPRKIGKHNTGSGKTGRRVSDKKQTHSARGPLLAVLLVVLVVLSWYLFGGKFMERMQNRQEDPIENVDPVPENPDTGDPTDDPASDPSDLADPDEPTPPVVDDSDEPTPSNPATVDVSSLRMKTNVGSLSKDTATGKYDCTIKTSESVRLIVEGTDAQVTWTSGDTSVVTVGTDGALRPLKTGTTTITARVGGAALECIIRVK